MNNKEPDIYVNSIKNDPENQCCYVVDYLIRRDKKPDRPYCPGM